MMLYMSCPLQPLGSLILVDKVWKSSRSTRICVCQIKFICSKVFLNPPEASVIGVPEQFLVSVARLLDLPREKDAWLEIRRTHSGDKRIHIRRLEMYLKISRRLDQRKTEDANVLKREDRLQRWTSEVWSELDWGFRGLITTETGSAWISSRRYIDIAWRWKNIRISKVNKQLLHPTRCFISSLEALRRNIFMIRKYDQGLYERANHPVKI